MSTSDVAIHFILSSSDCDATRDNNLGVDLGVDRSLWELPVLVTSKSQENMKYIATSLVSITDPSP